MATTKIRGITIELNGDASKLNKALDDVNETLNNTSRQLKDVDRLLKLDPSNTVLLEQKQRLLGDSIKQNEAKLEELKKAQEAFNNEGVSKTSEQYMALTREIEATHAAIERARGSAGDFSSGVERWGVALGEVSSQADALAEKTAGISKAAQGALAAVGGIAVGAVKSFGDYEQLVGGVETLFKDSSDIVLEYAQNAYKTTGMSANEYLTTVTNFSAALVSSLGGNVTAAAHEADIAMTDIADNANKFGTDIETVENAYMGFAKQNYSMLDNLKLGFSGTKEGMQQLLDKAEELTGAEFSIDSFVDIVNAIHEVQSSMGITGTTAAEAADTINGSFATVKASLENLLTGLGDSTADVGALTDAVIESGQALASNVAPVLQNIWDHIPDLGQTVIKLTAITALISPMAGLIAKVSGAVANLLTIWPKLQAAGTAIKTFAAADPWALIAGAVVAAVALIVANWDKIKTFFDNVKQKFQDFFADVKGYMSNAGTLTGTAAATASRGGNSATYNNTTNVYNQTASQPLQVNLQMDGKTMAKGLYQPSKDYSELKGQSFVY